MSKRAGGFSLRKSISPLSLGDVATPRQMSDSVTCSTVGMPGGSRLPPVPMVAVDTVSLATFLAATFSAALRRPPASGGAAAAGRLPLQAGDRFVEGKHARLFGAQAPDGHLAIIHFALTDGQ